MYRGTRHNVGFAVVEALAAKWGWSLRKRMAWKGRVAEGSVEGKRVVLLEPLTFMNQSGIAVAYAACSLEIEPAALLVVVDDVALPFTTLRLRAQGSSGGHNGLASVAKELHTNSYPRLRSGVGEEDEGDLARYVLSQFSLEEQKALPDIVARSVQAIELWLAKGLTSAMDFANRPSNPSIGEEHG
jgi:PTH1 family peptidyl-tRNA hydrolase